MPACTLILLALSDILPEDFVRLLLSDGSDPKVILASLPQFHVVKSTSIDVSELDREWDLLLLLEGTPTLPARLTQHASSFYSLVAGVPSKLIKDFDARNKEIRSRKPPPLTGSLESGRKSKSSQTLAYSTQLENDAKKLMHNTPLGKGPVTQLNLLAFKNEPTAKAEYHTYGQKFAKVGGKRGGDAKIVGNIIPGAKDSRNGRQKGEWWDELALAHYPSILHFCDMSAGEDYREINEEHRLKALKDTVLLCTVELDLAKLRGNAKL